MRNLCCVLVMMTSLLYPVNADEFSHGVSVSWGEGSSRYTLLGDREMTPDAYRITYVMPALKQWTLTSSQQVGLELDFSAHHWNDQWQDQHISGLSVVPMFRWRMQFSQLSLYAGVGIGAMAIDDDEWMDRKLGSQLQFEDKFELGIQGGQHRLAVTLSHYSNADLADINHGVNVYYVSYTWLW